MSESKELKLLLHLTREVKMLKALIYNTYKQPIEMLKREWVDAQDVMQLLKISPRTLLKLRHNMDLPYSRINGRIMYKVKDLENLLESNYTPTKLKYDGDK